MHVCLRIGSITEVLNGEVGNSFVLLKLDPMIMFHRNYMGFVVDDCSFRENAAAFQKLRLKHTSLQTMCASKKGLLPTPLVKTLMYCIIPQSG